MATVIDELEVRLAAGESLGVGTQQDLWAVPVWRVARGRGGGRRRGERMESAGGLSGSLV